MKMRTKDVNYREQPRKRAPIDFMVTEQMKIWAEEKAPGVDIETETEAFMDCDNFPRAHMDWTATWRNWFRREQKQINRQQSNRDFYAGKIQKPVTTEQTKQSIVGLAEITGIDRHLDEVWEDYCQRVLAANQRRIERLMN